MLRAYRNRRVRQTLALSRGKGEEIPSSVVWVSLFSVEMTSIVAPPGNLRVAWRGFSPSQKTIDFQPAVP
ncbi:MAG: hypothetical protein KAI39_01630 [Desulfobulbaceae bacterium]|nr:hypothetical protein [Desulfobulbaceae bacterium]